LTDVDIRWLGTSTQNIQLKNGRLSPPFHYRLYPVFLDHPLARPFGLELYPAVGLPPSLIPLSSFFVMSATYTTTIVFPLVSGLSVKNPFVCGAFRWFVDLYPATEHPRNMADLGPFLVHEAYRWNKAVPPKCDHRKRLSLPHG
jgi:hypothetical protein